MFCCLFKFLRWPTITVSGYMPAHVLSLKSNCMHLCWWYFCLCCWNHRESVGLNSIFCRLNPHFCWVNVHLACLNPQSWPVKSAKNPIFGCEIPEIPGATPTSHVTQSLWQPLHAVTAEDHVQVHRLPCVKWGLESAKTRGLDKWFTLVSPVLFVYRSHEPWTVYIYCVYIYIINS